MITLRKRRKQIILFTIGLAIIIIYCEYLIYFISALQCEWPKLEDDSIALKAFILADIHLLGPRKGHWLDKWRRETQMHTAFQSITTIHQPDVVFILGDLFDEGEWSNDKQFSEYVGRFHKLFHVPNHVKLHIVVGNHDIGFHNSIRRGSAERFVQLLDAPSVQLLTIKDNHFVLINSMALHGDSCNLCIEARKAIANISEILRCSRTGNCHNKAKRIKYSRPILMQHFPLFRESDAICTESDSPPLPERLKRFRLRIDALSQEATYYIVDKVRPRAVFGGHTHHGCLVQHSMPDENFNFIEYSVPSFSWRNRPDPKYILATITPHKYAIQKCGLPMETTMFITALCLLIVLVYFVFYKKCRI